MLTRDDIMRLLGRLNAGLEVRGQLGEIGLVGGAVMCLVYNARAATKDIDAVFEPAGVMREIASQIAEEEFLSPDWLNDAAKGFLEPGFHRSEFCCLSHLRVWVPEPRYMLAMKCISARWDTSDRDDVIFLLDFLKIKDADQVFSLLEGYYPKRLIPAKTRFLIEEVLSEK